MGSGPVPASCVAPMPLADPTEEEASDAVICACVNECSGELGVGV